jgi:hypothetical protein
MSFTALVPYSGRSGYDHLTATRADQEARYAAEGPVVDRLEFDAFRERIATVSSAGQLLDDGPLRRTALRAFGLGGFKVGEPEPSRAFVEAALTADASDEEAFLKRFGDAGWLEMNRAFGFSSEAGARTGEAGFADEIAARWRMQGFERAVGVSNPNLRRALDFERTMTELAAVGYEAKEGWRRALADGEVRAVLQTALELGPGFEAAPRERQIEQVQDAYRRFAGQSGIEGLTDTAARDALLDRFFSRAGGVVVGAGAPRTGEGFDAWAALDADLADAGRRFAASLRRDPDAAHVRREIGGVSTAAELVADETLRRVALEAYGLGDSRASDAFLTQVLESDPLDAESFAATQDDPRWLELAKGFGFGAASGPQTGRFGFADRLIDRARMHGLEEAAGAEDDTVRVALVADRALESFAAQGASWERALGHPTVAHAFATALGLSREIAEMTPEERAAAVSEAAAERWGAGSLGDFADEETRRELARDLFRAEAEAAEDKPNGLGQPLIPLGGMAGWAFLGRTLEEQRESFADSFAVRRETDHFRERIGEIGTAEELVADRRLLTVALGAFGLEEEAWKTAFIREALEGGTENPEAMGAKLVDPRWKDFIDAFGFGNGSGARTAEDGFADRVVARYEVRAFEAAVGEQDQSLRLALNFDRAAAEIARSGISDDAAWFRALGEKPMRSVLEGALGLPSEFATIDLDRQRETVRDRISGLLGAGGFAAFADGGNRQDLIRRFLAREQLGGGAFSGPGAGAVALMQGAVRLASMNRLL